MHEQYEIEMPNNKRSKKRHRNKFSPQILSTAKKYRQIECVNESIVEQTDNTDDTEAEVELVVESVTAV